MGLFKSWADKLKIKNKAAVYDIVCLSCFKKFSSDDVVFRAAKILEEDGYTAQIDFTLDAYREKFNMSSAGPMEAVIQPKNLPAANRRYTNDILTSLVDDYDNETDKRLCPFCHNDLQKNAGKYPSTIISIVGASQVGKSVYMTSLIHILKNSTSINFNASCLPISQEMNRRFKENYEDLIFQQGRLLDPTQKEKQQEPIMFNFSFLDSTKPEVNLVFFDVAGEGMVDKEYLDIYASHIKNSAGILFLIDPLQIKTISQRLNVLAGGAIQAPVNYDEPTDVLISLIDNFIEAEEQRRTDIPTAIMLTKSDLLYNLKDDYYIKENSNIFRNYVHQNFFSLSEYYNISGDVEELLKKVDPSFRNAVMRHFTNVGYFAVSSLGRNPVEQRVDSAIEPMRVDEPFLWLLNQLEYVEGK